MANLIMTSSLPSVHHMLMRSITPTPVRTSTRRFQPNVGLTTRQRPFNPAMPAITPLAELKVEKHQISAHGKYTPNTSIQHKPLLIYRSAFAPKTTAGEMETHLKTVGVVVPQWRYSMYKTSHFHTTSHEVLAISAGAARLCFGHEDNASCLTTIARQGDVIVVPAGVAHRLLSEEGEGGFEMVGSYPTGHNWDMCYGVAGEEGKIAKIARLQWFERDPVYGEKGPVLDC